jgi:hypothetical protein
VNATVLETQVDFRVYCDGALRRVLFIHTCVLRHSNYERLARFKTLTCRDFSCLGVLLTDRSMFQCAVRRILASALKDAVACWCMQVASGRVRLRGAASECLSEVAM